MKYDAGCNGRPVAVMPVSAHGPINANARMDGATGQDTVRRPHRDGPGPLVPASAAPSCTLSKTCIKRPYAWLRVFNNFTSLNFYLGDVQVRGLNMGRLFSHVVIWYL